MTLHRIAAFSDGASGGNPAGVHLSPALPDETTMRRIAAEVGYSETAFAAPLPDGGWRVRYFSPESEVPFCGHATIALGAVLAGEHGDGAFALVLNEARITVEGRRDGDGFAATLQSPPTRSTAAAPGLVAEALALFGWHAAQLDARLPPARIHAGADHLLLALADRGDLAAMRYDLDDGRRLMRGHGLVTIALAHWRDAATFDVRNAFASGGVLEDPATGAAAAALAGHLRDSGRDPGGRIDLVQGEDMGCRSLLRADFDPMPGGPVRVSGRARWIDA
jgi:PhzF family phenazine biosynthesis protein